MRTIRIELHSPIGDSSPLAIFNGGQSVTISTEVLVGDDDDAATAGREACSFITDFISGYGEESQP